MVTAAAGGELSSAGHRLGQMVGDWWEANVIFPQLQEVANELGLFLDNRIVSRTCRTDKIKWADADGNFVDYDYVLELGGSEDSKGVPLAFIESFWRRGARHSKDKARDDTNKLLPMRDAYPTARFLAIAACGEFTEPAKEYVRSRNVELFYIGKDKIVEAFQSIGAPIDYPDSLAEDKKAAMVRVVESKFDTANRILAAENLKRIVGVAAFRSFKQKIAGALATAPQEIRIWPLARFGPVVFESISAAAEFLKNATPVFPGKGDVSHYEYQVSFSDGSVFFRELDSLDAVRDLNQQLLTLVKHFEERLK